MRDQVNSLRVTVYSKRKQRPLPFLSTSLRGFTLIEMMVSVALFLVVILIAVGSLVGMVDADRKAQSIQSVVDNLDFALDDISRTVRTGTVFHCVDGGTNPSAETAASMATVGNCSSSGSLYMAVEGSAGSRVNVNDQIVYWFAPQATCGAGFVGGCIERSINSGGIFLPLTSPNVSIDASHFYVIGASAGPIDHMQPKATMVLTAHILLSDGTQTTLHLQTTLTQRSYDE